MSQVLVSIIIPVYNNSCTVIETLNSIKHQSFRNWECIIVDDGSKDDSYFIIEKFIKSDKRFKLFKRSQKRPKGANACRNIGKENSLGEFILFMDADDLLEHSCLEGRLSYFNDESIDAVIFDTGTFREEQDEINIFNRYLEYSNCNSYLDMFLTYEIPWNIMGPLWKAKSIKQIAFDEKLQRLQDLDFHIRILQTPKLDIKRIHVIDNLYRLTNKTPTLKNVRVVYKSSMYFFKKMFVNGIQYSSGDKLKRFMVFLLIKFYYNNYTQMNKEIKAFEKLMFSNLSFSIREKTLLSLKKASHKFKFQSIKNIGMNVLNKLVNKEFSI